MQSNTISWLKENTGRDFSSQQAKAAINRALRTKLGGGFNVTGSGSAKRYGLSDEMHSMQLVSACA